MYVYLYIFVPPYNDHDLYLTLEILVDWRVLGDLRVGVDTILNLIYHAINFIHIQVWAADDVDEHGVGSGDIDIKRRSSVFS